MISCFMTILIDLRIKDFFIHFCPGHCYLVTAVVQTTLLGRVSGYPDTLGRSWDQASKTVNISCDQSDVTAPAARKFCSRERHWCMIDFMMKEHYKCIIWVTRALPTYIHTPHGGTSHFGLVLWVTRARSWALPFWHDGVDEKTFWFLNGTNFFF